MPTSMRSEVGQRNLSIDTIRAVRSLLHIPHVVQNFASNQVTCNRIVALQQTADSRTAPSR